MKSEGMAEGRGGVGRPPCRKFSGYLGHLGHLATWGESAGRFPEGGRRAVAF